MKGKVTVINSVLLPQLQYVISSLYVPTDVILEVNNLIFTFLWPRKAHVKKSTVIQQIDKGGIKMPDFESKVKACKVSWIKRLCHNSKCAAFAEEMGLPLPLNEMLLVKYDMKYMPDYVSPFYKRIL